MAVVAPSRILLCADALAHVDDVRHLLERAGFAVHPQTFSDPEPSDLFAYHLVVLDGTRQPTEALQLCRRLRGRNADDFLPVLFVTANHAPAARFASLESGADAYLLRPFEPAELLGQVRALLRIKEGHDRLAEKTAGGYRITGQKTWITSAPVADFFTVFARTGAEKRLTVFFRPLEGEPPFGGPGRRTVPMECVVTGVDKAGIVACVARALGSSPASIASAKASGDATVRPAASTR